MWNFDLTLVTHENLEPVLKCIELESADRLDTTLGLREALKYLIAQEERADVIRVLSAALPPRPAVWWACVCVRYAADSYDKHSLAALETAEAWTKQPSEGLRRQAWNYAEQAKFATGGAWVGCASFWSGGDISEEGSSVPIMPNPKMLPNAVSGAVLLAVAEREPESLLKTQDSFIAKGLNIAAGGWGTN